MASSTLSEIIWEKLKTTPGKAAFISSESWSVSPSLVTPLGHSSNGLSGAKSSMLLKPAESVPSSGRPSWETTVSTSGFLAFFSSHSTFGSSGQPRRMARMRPTYLADWSSEMLVGKLARIQKLPSSSLGMNSPPR